MARKSKTPSSPNHHLTHRVTRSTRATEPSPEPSTSTSTRGSSEDEMMHRREDTGLRGRMVEDVQDVGEKGAIGYDKSESRHHPLSGVESKEGGGGLTSVRDRKAFALLIVLCGLQGLLVELTLDLLQGIPIGLTFGTLPFLLKPHLSYSQLALFSLSTWPYSLKLLWSPLVDAWFVPAWGRRKSWIVPVQSIVALALWVVGGKIESWLEADVIQIRFITTIFISLIFFAATQDIAVDGWALTLLSAPNLSYASTAQTIGLNTGYFLSFTVFLAFNSVDFSNRYFRSLPLDYPLITLGGYLRFWAMVYACVTVWLAFGKTEDAVSENDPDMDVRKVYKIMWSIVRLKNIQSFILIHLVAKIGFQVNDSVTGLKLLEKGLSKEDLAVAVLIDFPFQMAGGWLAARWARQPGGGGPLRPWLGAFWARLGMAVIATLVVASFPKGGGAVGNVYFGAVIATTLLASFTSTIQFVGITAFHTQVADPLIGGTYMTLLNTVSNLGGTWPKPIVLKGVDYLTKATCLAPDEKTSLLRSVGECVSDVGKAHCGQVSGECVLQRDGYYPMSMICVGLGAVLLVTFIIPTTRKLQSLPMSAWRVKIPN